jgi:hypothetical protein
MPLWSPMIANVMSRSVTFILKDVSNDFDVLIANVDRPPFPRGVIHRYSAAL